jgi:predicted DNA-binding transcriptional regulator AlpA
MADEENMRSHERVGQDAMDSRVSEALGRKSDRQTSSDAELPRRKLSVQEAGRFLGLSASNLNKLRVTGGGPRFMKLGRRVLYDWRELEAWASERTRSHTSESPRSVRKSESPLKAPQFLPAWKGHSL